MSRVGHCPLRHEPDLPARNLAPLTQGLCHSGSRTQPPHPLSAGGVEREGEDGRDSPVAAGRGDQRGEPPGPGASL